MNEVSFPWPDKSLSPNSRGHWSVKAKAAKAYLRTCWALALKAKLKVNLEGPIDVAITFHPPDNRRRDLDNCIASFKSGFDGLAFSLRVNDSQFRISAFLAGSEKPGRVFVSISQ